MKIKDFLRLHSPGIKLVESWLFTLNLFFILYSIVGLFTFLLGPDSGRLSTLVCRPDAQGRSLCTVTISGLGEIFRSSFWADEFRDAYTSNNILLSQRNRLSFMNLALPWEDVVESDYSTLNDSPDGLVCAVSIKTVDKFIDFLPPYQHETKCDQAEGQIEAAFDDDRSAINIRFDGYSPNIARRIEVLAIAGLLLLGQSASGYIRRRQDRKLVIQAEEPKKLLQLESVGAVLIPGEKGTEDVSHPNWMSTRKFILAWWTASILIIALWVVTSYLDGWSIFRPNCFLSVWDYRSLISITPVRNLISISPWIIFSTLLAVLQWHVLRMQIHVSGWWIAAPVIAGLPLLFGLPHSLSCFDINSLEIPFLEWDPYLTVTTWWEKVAYLLVVGCIQWLVLHKKLRYSIGWILIPFLIAFTEGQLLVAMILIYVFHLLGPTSFLSPIVIAISPILIMLDTIFTPMAGFYLYRLILARRKKLLIGSQGGEEAMAR